MREALFRNITLFALFIFSSVDINAQKTNSIKVKIDFASDAFDYSITKAVLKYNKDFAYSFTLDDGKEDAYTNAYVLFNGGTFLETKKNYPGLYYTDGCGNKVSFTAGLAINAANSDGKDPHNNTKGTITWDQIKELHGKGWNILNHSYTHQAGPGTNYKYEITENRSYIQQKTGVDAVHFVIPSGDTNYIIPAFSNGMKAVYNQGSMPGANGLKVDGNIDLNQFRLFRQFLTDGNSDIATFRGRIDEVAGKSIHGNHYWYNEFTHHVMTKPYGGSLTFSILENYMNYIQNTYGYNGSDRIWMAPLQEVYEYLAVRENIKITNITQNGTSVEFYLDDSMIPTDLQKYALTLSIDASADITNVEGVNVTSITYNGRGPNKLVNIEWDKQSVIRSDPGSEFDPCAISSTAIYPNPFANNLSVDLNDSTQDDFTIYFIDDLGREIKIEAKNIKKDQRGFIINFEAMNLPPGRYYLKFVSEKKKCSITRSVIKR